MLAYHYVQLNHRNGSWCIQLISAPLQHEPVNPSVISQRHMELIHLLYTWMSQCSTTHIFPPPLLLFPRWHPLVRVKHTNCRVLLLGFVIVWRVSVSAYKYIAVFCVTSDYYFEHTLYKPSWCFRTAPYHPSSNGLAERAVQTFKQGLRRNKEGSLETRLARFLFTYRLTPQTSTGQSPAELLLGRRPRSRLDVLHPDTALRVQRSQLCQKQHHDIHAKARNLQVGDRVYIKNFTGQPAWKPGVIVEQTGPVSFQVETADGRKQKRHVDHLRIWYPKDTSPGNYRAWEAPNLPNTQDPRHITEGQQPTAPDASEPIAPPLSSAGQEPVVTEPPSSVRRSGRSRRPPDRFGVWAVVRPLTVIAPRGERCRVLLLGFVIVWRVSVSGLVPISILLYFV